MSTQICTESERLLDLLHGEVVVLGHLPPPAHLARLVPLVVGNHGLVPANRYFSCNYIIPCIRAVTGTLRNLDCLSPLEEDLSPHLVLLCGGILLVVGLGKVQEVGL